MNQTPPPQEGMPQGNPLDQPAKPLYVAPNTGRDTYSRNNAFTRKVYFFQREDGTTFFTDAKDAWAILKGRKQRVGFFPERLKLIGVSDGSMFQKAAAEAQAIFKSEGLEAAQVRIRRGHEEELAEARKKVEMPPNPDNVDLQGNPFDLNALR